MTQFKLAFGIHNHQPVGNFDHVFKEAHRQAYAPFLKLLQEFPKIAISLHQSGILWSWQQREYPEYFKTVRKMVRAGQLELMTGGFYEPILSAIPERDVYSQIERLNDFLDEHFGCRPDGLWLAERIWEPHLPKVLAQSNIRYLPIDDTHFVYAGLENDQLTGPFVTESEGHTVRLLPILKRLRYLIPFGVVEKVIDFLKELAERNPDGTAVYADDGEKFGVWPETHHHCYEDGWLRDFFEAVEKNSDWLQVVPLGAAASESAVGRAYLPTASYAEMLHWALPTRAYEEYEQFEGWLKEQGRLEQYGRFVRGGHWRGFLTKYEESNLMHKKMLAVSNSLEVFKRENPDRLGELEAARDHLFAAQCNCPYWHGVFGGLYLPHVRQAIYENVIAAQSALNKLYGKRALTITRTDFDCDGHDEVVVSSDALSVTLKPSSGGMLVDLSLNRHNFSLTDTLTRRREGYHDKLGQAVVGSSSGTASIHDTVLAKEEGLKDVIAEDWYLKRCFVDHLLASSTDVDNFMAVRYDEEGDFVVEPYECTIDEGSKVVTLIREGSLRRGGRTVLVRIIKRFRFEDDSESFNVEYEVTTLFGEKIDVVFAVENNFSFQAGHTDDRYVLIDRQRPEQSFLDSVERHGEVRSYTLADEYRNLGVAVVSDTESEIWRHPIFTVSLSEGGFEKVYQGTTLLHVYRVNLSGEPFKVSLGVHTGSIEDVVAAGTDCRATKSI